MSQDILPTQNPKSWQYDLNLENNPIIDATPLADLNKLDHLTLGRSIVCSVKPSVCSARIRPRSGLSDGNEEN
jgi:hypothetical protein